MILKQYYEHKAALAGGAGIWVAIKMEMEGGGGIQSIRQDVIKPNML